MNLDEMKSELTQLGFPAFRAKQLLRHVHKNGKTNFAEMTDFSKELQHKLQEKYFITKCDIISESKTGNTIKQLLRFADDEMVETVLMLYTDRKEQRERITLCISTQVGCAMGCTFCATGLSDFSRNLSTGEILAQIWSANRTIQPKRVTNVVFMGMGEPLANYDAVIKAIKLINEPEGLNIGIRRITVSTSGLTPQIRRLAKENLGIVLAISLHAPNDELRSELMPINKTYSLAKLMTAIEDYTSDTGRRITIEYVMLHEVNDKPEYARQLGALLKGKLVHVNLIPYNRVNEAPFKRSPSEKITAFRDILIEKGIDTVIREEMGGEIDAACGQLRRKNLQV